MITILYITTEWPQPEALFSVPFIVRQVEFLQRAGVNVEVFHFRGGKNPLNYLFAWYQVQCCLASGHFDLIHAQWGQSALLALPKKCPIVITYRGSDLDGFLDKNGSQSFVGRLLQLISRSISLLADQVIVVSAHLADKLPNISYEVIPSGIDLNHFYPMDKTEVRHQLKLPAEDKIILFAGNPDIPDKRFKLAESAVDMIKVVYPQAHLLIANKVAYEQMPVYMNCSDVLILTSAHEGSPNVVKEALACNIPIVSTDVGDVRKRIGSIDGCFVCENDEPETIAIALKQSLDRGKRINGRETVHDLDENILTQRVIAVYKKALSG